METEYTPGPWRVDNHLATVVDGRGTPITGATNARLIAAAPDLLAAAQEIVRKYEKIMADPPDWTNFTGNDDLRLVFAREAWYGAAKIARAAIAKAVSLNGS